MVNARDNLEQMDFVAPDGGWGWIVALGTGISNMVLLSVIQTFGLIYKDRFDQLQFSATDTTSLMSINSSFGMILGILNGPLLKRYGYRKMALLGGAFFVSGFFFTSFSIDYIHFVITYGMTMSIGISISMSAFSLALNTYFKLKRSTASSLSITIMGLGPIILPPLITHLLSSYGWRWTLLILTAMTMNTFVGALLLQPIKWHLHRQKESKEAQPSRVGSVLQVLHGQTQDAHSLLGYGTSYLDASEILGKSESELNEGKSKSQQSLHRSTINLNKNRRSITTLDNEDYGDMMNSTLHILENIKMKEKPARYASAETLDEKSSKDNSHEMEKFLGNGSDENSKSPKTTANGADRECDFAEESAQHEEDRGFFKKTSNFITKMYDFDLFTDPIYINIMIGLSFATVGEIIFSLLTPFILMEMGLSLKETATFMSVTGITDLTFRLLSPCFGQWLKASSRLMYMIAVFILMLTRTSLFIPRAFTGFLVIAVGLGIGKGFRTVYWSLVIPDYVPLHKLPSASAFQSLCNGISLLVSGPILGAIISLNNNKYTNVVFAANLLTLTTIILWSTEFIILLRKKKRLKKLQS